MKPPRGDADFGPSHPGSLRESVSAVERKSTELPNTLTTLDLFFLCMLCTIGLGSGPPAKLGSYYFLPSVAAFALFLAPSILVVLFLSNLMPIEGGIYQWTRLGLGERAGFMTSWNLWLFNLTSLAAAGTEIAEYLRVGMGAGDWFSGSNSIWIGLLVMLLVATITLRGLQIGRWIHNAGSAVT
jgi:amino acid transporter